MLKKTITFEDYSEPPKDVSRDFYFNFNKLEILEMLELEDLDGTMQRLQETQDGPEAYRLFKKIVLRAYGEKNSDGGFDKEDENGRPLWKKFEAHPACSELIVGFIENPSEGAAFIEGALPAKMVAQAKEEMAKEQKTGGELTATVPQQVETPKNDESSDEELLKMKPQDMTPAQLQRAYMLKSQQ